MPINIDKIAAEVNNIPAKDWLPDTYLPFALYVIRDRALVDSSGLKPVQQRIVWTMFKNGITPNSGYLKAARVAGDTMAYHPHGNSSIEDALAGLAQDFNKRVTLIDPQGSVGKVWGDTPAAARYWEARLTKAAMELVKEVNDGAVPMGKNYDGELDEPKVLPVRWPVEIINGSSGIAVGYSSNMAPHNPTEVITAARKILKKPEMTIKELLKVMPGPDFPTGGELYGIDGIQEYYETGKGTVVVRGRYKVEDMTRGKKRIIFYELPYGISAEKVMTRIRELQDTGQFKEIADVKDLTDKKHGLRLSIETKSGSNHLRVLSELFKKTPVEDKFPVNSTVLVNNNPVKIGMLDLLKNFINFRKYCTLNKAEYRIKKIDSRLKQVDALLAALLDIDKAIKIIRNSATVDDARNGLMKTFKIDEEQADYILGMQLRRLTKADSVALKTEKKELQEERKHNQDILKNESTLIQEVDTALQETLKIIKDDRRTVISGATTEDLKEEQKTLAKAAKLGEKNVPCYVTRFANGTVLKSEKQFVYSNKLKNLKYSPIIEQLKMMTQDEIIIVGSDGLGRRIPLSYFPDDKNITPKKAGVVLPAKVKFVGIAKYVSENKKDVGLAMFTKLGKVKIAKMDFPKNEEAPVFLLDSKDEVIDSRWIDNKLESTFFSTTSKNGNILIFDASSIRVSGSKAGGVAGMKLKDSNDSVVSFDWIKNIKDSSTMIISHGNKSVKLTPASDIPTKNKGGMGVALQLFNKDEKEIVSSFVGSNLVAALTDKTIISLPPLSRRATKGTPFNIEVLLGTLGSEE